MFLLSFSIAIVWAAPVDGFPAIPNDLILPIVANIGSYRDLCALNMTSKAFYPIIRPIFDFTSACQVAPSDVWPNSRLEIKMDAIANPVICANHLMKYSFLYKRILLTNGGPSSVAGLFNHITVPILYPVDVIFRSGSLNSETLTEVIESITVGSVNLDLFRQTIDSKIVEVFTRSLDRRINNKSPINGILIDVNDQELPLNLLANFFRVLPYSDLKRLTISEPLYNNSLFQLSAVLPLSKLDTFEFVSSSSTPIAELKALGSALVLTPTMKKISFRFVDSSNVLIESMIPGLDNSNIEHWEITYGNNMGWSDAMDTSVGLLTTLPKSLKVLNLAGNSLHAATIVNLIAVVSRSNVQVLSLFRNNAQLNATHVHRIADLLVGSKLRVLNVADNSIGAQGEAILKRAGNGIEIITRSLW